MTGEKWRESPFLRPLLISCFICEKRIMFHRRTDARCANDYRAYAMLEKLASAMVVVYVSKLRISRKHFFRKQFGVEEGSPVKWLFLLLGSQDAGSGFRKRHVADESQGEFPAMRWVLGKSVAYRKKPSIDMTVPLRNRGHRGQAGMVVVRIACWFSVSRKLLGISITRPTRM